MSVHCRFSWIPIWAVAVLAWPGAGLAQEVVPSPPLDLPVLRDHIVVLSTGGDSPVTPVDRDPVTVEAGQANGKGTVVIKPKAQCEAKGWQSPCWSINFSAPTDKSSEITDFTNLDGLAKDLAAGVSARWIQAPGPMQVDAVLQICEAFEADPANAGKECDSDTFEQWLAGKAVEMARKGTAESEAFVASLTPEATSETLASLQSLLEEAADWGMMWGFEAKVSHNEYEFFDGSAASAKTDELGGSLMFSWAKQLGGSFRLGLSAGFQRAWETSKVKAQACTETEEPPGLESCKELPLGAPTEHEGGLARVELRWAANQIILAPLVSYDEAMDVWGVDLPIYFLKDPKAGYTGGFRVGWRSDKDKPVASVFVSKRLGL